MEEQNTKAIQQYNLPQPKKGKAKIILAGVGIVGLGTLAFFGWRKLNKKPNTHSESYSDYSSSSGNSAYSNYSASLPPATTSITSSGGFPIKRGSKGEKVKAIQQVLSDKGLLDSKDVIGQFGPKTEAALIKAGLPVVINKSAYNAIVSPKNNSTPEKPNQSDAPIDAAAFATGLYKAAVGKNFNAAMTLLRLMKTTADYSAVSEKFKTFYLNGVRQTLVNGMLSSFSSIDQKAEIKSAFLKMGLKYDGSKFTLSGISNRGIITKRPTIIYDQSLQGISVPSNMILGTEAGRNKQFTQFKNNGRYFIVPTTSINYL